MPYFYRKDNDKYCVYKGTPKEPEERMKCYDTSAEAQKYVAALMSATEDESKAVMSSGQRTSLPDSAFLYIEPGGEKKDGKTVPDSKRHLPVRKADGSLDLPHLRNAISRLSQSATGTGKDSWLSDSLRKSLLTKARKLLADASKSSFTIKRQSDGSYRWWSVSSVAIRDKEDEIVSEKAYDDAISYASEESLYGDLDLVHIKGTSIGECDGMVRLGKLLVESGTIPDTPRARGVIKAIEADPDYWGVSLKFTFDPEQYDTESRTYQGGVRIINRTVLPKWMAASYGTAISVKGGTMKMDKDAIEALKALGISDDEIQTLSEQEKSTEPPNVVEKADETEQPEEAQEEDPSWVQKFLSDLATRLRKPVEQAEKADESASTEVEAPETPPAIEIDYDEIVKRVLVSMQEANTAVVNKALEPLGPALQAIVEWVELQDKRIEALETPIEDQITKRISELPPVVKVGATTVEASAPPQVVGETAPEQTPGPYASLMGQIVTSVESAVGRKLDEAKIDV